MLAAGRVYGLYVFRNCQDETSGVREHVLSFPSEAYRIQYYQSQN